MTVTITQDIRDIAGVPDNAVVSFWQAEDPRPAADGVTMISTRRVSVTPVAGHITVELEPGPAHVQLGPRVYPFMVPDVGATLLPLILAAMPPAPPILSAFVRNLGGVVGERVVTASWYAANPHDPETLYIVMPD